MEYKFSRTEMEIVYLAGFGKKIWLEHPEDTDGQQTKWITLQDILWSLVTFFVHCEKSINLI